MKIKKIKVQNFRLLKDFSIDLEDNLSLVLWKNNCGKTSLLSVLDKFLNPSSSKFAFNDFNIDFKWELEALVVRPVQEMYKPLGITLKLFVEYGENDNLSRVGNLMMDLDPENNKVVLLFEYVLTLKKLVELKSDYSSYCAEMAARNAAAGQGRDSSGDPSHDDGGRDVATESEEDISVCAFIRNSHSNYFELFRKTIECTPEGIENELNFIDLDKAKIPLNDFIHFRHIKANRDVSNKEPDKSLSLLSSKIYKKIKVDPNQASAIKDFMHALGDTDKRLNGIYDGIFEGVIEKIKQFWGIKENETIISVTSTLQHQQLLEDNTTVMYRHWDHFLPENYNWLGYMNLISMIFEIEILAKEFEEKNADINLLFIEEPEAHTHPQMQYVFIKNIKGLLKGVGNLQCVISTHSSHIVAESDFVDIKYLVKQKDSVIAKNLRDLEKEYEIDGERDAYRFLKQYLTLHRAELFFADKAIFIEGDTERILLPAMMKKIDQVDAQNPLLSQNISIIEVWNYSKVFEKFIDFIGIKSLIITDIDSSFTEGKKRARRVDDPQARITTNSSLVYFYGTNDLAYFKDKDASKLILAKVLDETTGKKKWKPLEEGLLACVYQVSEPNAEWKNYCWRSFEDSFFHLNKKFIADNKSAFESLKCVELLDDPDKDSYDLAEECITKKPPFAIEILMNSKTDESWAEFGNWKTPAYIERWLVWLKG